jgi:hypothetical protein
MNYHAKLEQYLAGVETLNSILTGLSEKDLNYRPDRPDAWTIKEHVIHLVDSELNGFIRCKSIIAQPGTECYVMDEDLWTANLRRKNEDMSKYLRLFGLVRSIAYDLLKDEPAESWTNNYFTRTYQGETKKVTLEQWIELYCNHLRFHFEYIDAIKAGLG